MHQTCKGKQWYFGMKVHIGVDSESGLIHSVETTAAHVHDLTPAAQLLHGGETVGHGNGKQQCQDRDEWPSDGAVQAGFTWLYYGMGRALSRLQCL